MLRTILNKSWKQHPTKQQLYGNHPPISKTIQVQRQRHAAFCWGRVNSCDVFLLTSSHGVVVVGCPARTYIQQLCTDAGCNLEDLANAMDDRDKWRGKFRGNPNRRKRVRTPVALSDSLSDKYPWERYVSPYPPTCLPSRNYPNQTNQTCRTQLENQGRAHKWCIPMDPHIWPGIIRTTCSDIHIAAMWGYGM